VNLPKGWSRWGKYAIKNGVWAISWAKVGGRTVCTMTKGGELVPGNWPNVTEALEYYDAVQSLYAPRQEGLFNGEESDRLKSEGMELAANAQQGDLALAREIAMEIATDDADRQCDSDRVGRVLESRHGVTTLGPAAGSIFAESHWQFTGQFKKSERVKNHSRLVRVWRLV